MTQAREHVKQRIREVLLALSEDERRLFSEVLRVEHGNLHFERPRVKEELLESVRRNIK